MHPDDKECLDCVFFRFFLDVQMTFIDKKRVHAHLHEIRELVLDIREKMKSKD